MAKGTSVFEAVTGKNLVGRRHGHGGASSCNEMKKGVIQMLVFSFFLLTSRLESATDLN